jgi:hypothetical protein
MALLLRDLEDLGLKLNFPEVGDGIVGSNAVC